MEASWSHILMKGRAIASSSQSREDLLPGNSVFHSNPVSAEYKPASMEAAPSVSLAPNNTSEPATAQAMGCISTEPKKNFAEENPCRNLTEAFEELYIDTGTSGDEKAAATPSVKATELAAAAKKIPSTLVSPTGVAELGADCSRTMESNQTAAATPSKEDNKQDCPQRVLHFELHHSLQRELSQAVVNRVSFYSVIHDINKEATTMAENDDSSYAKTMEEANENASPLVMAVKDVPGDVNSKPSMTDSALIDEERWLLETIETRVSEGSRPVQACPPTFLQAMGEREYENPLSSLSSGSRTQLWKPSRSWWEAKSGKNPWIEPNSHNKRWRYLWPLIHYHKFLARCIKKLKRNGVDVKTSVSPVAVFLREEVCAVSDHLAAVSLFDSDEWMKCLQFFKGWTDDAAEKRLREVVSMLKLRPLQEPGDVDSPLLRSQIDEQFLRAMAASRLQMAGVGIQGERRKSKDKTGTPQPAGDVSQQYAPPYPHMVGHPPLYPRHPGGSPMHPAQNMNHLSPGGMHPNRWPYPPAAANWWGHGWGHAPPPPFSYGDDGSVQSGITGESFQHMNDYGYQAIPPPPFYQPSVAPTDFPNNAQAPGMTGTTDVNANDANLYNMNSSYGLEHSMAPSPAWAGAHVRDPSALYGQDMSACQPKPGTPGFGAPSTPHGVPSIYHGAPAGCCSSEFEPAGHGEAMASDQTPFKYDPNQMPLSPFWAHLDHATLAMMGLATPQGNISPHASQQNLDEQQPSEECSEIQPPADDGTNKDSLAPHAQPLLLWNAQYYGYGPYGAEGYAPPSPATQFMMSPQGHLGYNYGYYSPRRSGLQPGAHNKSRFGHKPPSTVAEEKPPRGKRGLATMRKGERESPSTVGTTETELSESCHA